MASLTFEGGASGDGDVRDLALCFEGTDRSLSLEHDASLIAQGSPRKENGREGEG